MNLLAAGRSPEALGVLDVMVREDPDLSLADNVQLARGRALTEVRRWHEAIAALDRPGLAGNSEAAAWRMRALAGLGAGAAAVRQMPVALQALAQRGPDQRSPFLIPAAHAAVAAGQPGMAVRWLQFVSDQPEAALAKGRALLAVGKPDAAQSLFNRLESSPRRPVKVQAELGIVQSLLALRRIDPDQAAARVCSISFRWRGDSIEHEALWLCYSLARRRGDHAQALSAGAALIRHGGAGQRLPALLADVHATLGALVGPNSRMPLPDAAGLYWEYRDLARGGGAGDALVYQLVSRLQAAGLYARAAELLEHQLFARAKDLAQGPLSVRVARLWLLAAKPERSLHAIRGTTAVVYPHAMALERLRIEAIALFQLGRTEQAVALLADEPETASLRAEMAWRRQDWTGVAAQAPQHTGDRLSEVQQVRLLRHAVALAMLGDETGLARLGRRFAPAFATLPTARVFAALTGKPESLQPDDVAQALAAMPSASPVGSDADLLDVSAGS